MIIDRLEEIRAGYVEEYLPDDSPTLILEGEELKEIETALRKFCETVSLTECQTAGRMLEKIKMFREETNVG